MRSMHSLGMTFRPQSQRKTRKNKKIVVIPLCFTHVRPSKFELKDVVVFREGRYFTAHNQGRFPTKFMEQEPPHSTCFFPEGPEKIVPSKWCFPIMKSNPEQK